MSVTYISNDRIATLILDYANSSGDVDCQTLCDLARALVKASNDDDVRVIVLVQRGAMGFHFGPEAELAVKTACQPCGETNDLRERRTGDESYAHLIDLKRLNIRKPILAAVHGSCVGISFEIALQCDIRIAADDARFGPASYLGANPTATGVRLISRLFRRSIAMEMLLTGSALDAYDAHRIGLVSSVVPARALGFHALELATRLAAQAP
jgi:E-phenylitaconyl-CoA hydratase